jgi:hypothetical protein
MAQQYCRPSAIGNSPVSLIIGFVTAGSFGWMLGRPSKFQRGVSQKSGVTMLTLRIAHVNALVCCTNFGVGLGICLIHGTDAPARREPAWPADVATVSSTQIGRTTVKKTTPEFLTETRHADSERVS